MKTLVSEFLFNEIASLQGCNFIKKKLHHRCFRVKFEKFLRTLILKNIYKRCPNTAETTLHKKFTGVVLVQITYRRSHRRCSVKNMFLRVPHYSQENTCVGVSL